MSKPCSWNVSQGLYCHLCAKALGLMNDVYTSALGQSTYQVDNIIKHTMTPSTSSSFVTVFHGADLGPYRDYIVTSQAAGVVEIDKKCRRNILWVCGRETGYAYTNGVPVGPMDGIALVLSSDPARAHIFPKDTARLKADRCRHCKGLVITSDKPLSAPLV